MTAGSAEASGPKTTPSADTLIQVRPVVDEASIHRATQVLRNSAFDGASWLTSRIEEDGTPLGANERNAWWRVPWALCLSGRRDIAGAVLTWAERTALTSQADLRPGAFGGDTEATPVYWLSHLAMAAQLLDRFDLASDLLSSIDKYRNPATGGVYLWRDPNAPRVEDWLMTAQVGLLAVLMGRETLRDETFAWFERVWSAQPALERGILYTAWNDGQIVADPLLAGSTGIVDMRMPRQMYFQPGAAAAFIAECAAQRQDVNAVAFARELLMLNVHGTRAQLDDPDSVHVCKFPWGAAQLLRLDDRVDWTPYLILLADWFAARQEPTGAWAPSAFTLTEPPTDVDRMWKTAEHVMEVQKMLVALASRGVTPSWAVTP